MVDDSEDDRWLMRRALQMNSRFVVVGEVGDGAEAMAYLSGQGPFENREEHPFPDVLLLDLKMPRVTGHEVLRWLQTQSFEGLFVAVISGSFLPQDVAQSLALGANAHYKKNPMQSELEEMIWAIEQLLDQYQSA